MGKIKYCLEPLRVYEDQLGLTDGIAQFFRLDVFSCLWGFKRQTNSVETEVNYRAGSSSENCQGKRSISMTVHLVSTISSII